MKWTGKMIETAREERGWTRAQLAEMLHIPATKMIRIEDGTINSAAYTLQLDALFTYHCADCGLAGCENCAPAQFRIEDLRYGAEDATDLTEIAEKVHRWMEEMIDEGWQLLQPITDGCLHLFRGNHV
jgi:DNA-binding XRE family transcriptional regulator